MSMDILKLLQELDFTEYEAKAYLALIQKSPLTGYAVALNSGVPRSKIYEVLGGMEERGEVIVSHEATALYSPLPPKELLAHKKRHAEYCFEQAEKALQNYTALPQKRENIWTINGDEGIINCAKEIIARASSRILLEFWPEEAGLLEEELRKASERGIEVIIVAYGKVEFDFTEVYLHRPADNTYEYGGRWITLSVDDREVLTGIVSLGADSRAATTIHPGLVMPITEQIIHDLYIIEILKKHTDILEKSFGPDLLSLRKKFNIGPDAVKQWLLMQED